MKSVEIPVRPSLVEMAATREWLRRRGDGADRVKRIADPSASAYRAAKQEAFDQAVRYGCELLDGFDIERTRFLVLVTTGVIIDDVDILHRGVTCRPINIAVRPESPLRSVFLTASR